MIIDRFENGLAVCERADGTFVQVLRGFLPEGAREGSVLQFQDGAWALDLEAERERRARLFARQEDLFS